MNHHTNHLMHLSMINVAALYRWTGSISGSAHSLPRRQAALSLPGTFISADFYATFAGFARRLSPPSSSGRFYDSKRWRFCHGAAPHVNTHHRHHHCHLCFIFSFPLGVDAVEALGHRLSLDYSIIKKYIFSIILICF